MADKTGIEWTDATWNPTTGCDKVSPGCDHCYAMTLAPRLKAMGSAKYQNDGDPATSGPGFGITEHATALDQPLRWKRPRRIFVNSMSDLFHKGVSADFIARVFAVMACAQQHTFQILTKRHSRMRSLLTRGDFQRSFWFAVRDLDPAWDDEGSPLLDAETSMPVWPLPNVWLGVSVEDQRWADARVPALLETPAAVRFLSCEPLLGPVDLLGDVEQPGPAIVRTGHAQRTDYGTGVEYDVDDQLGLDWVIVGGESGPGARPMHPQWARRLRDQCVQADIPFHFKQWGEWGPAPWKLQPADGESVEAYKARSNTEAATHAYAPWAHEHGHMLNEGHPAWGLERGDDCSPHAAIRRWGKHAAGRELDGRTWDEFPEVAHV